MNYELDILDRLKGQQPVIDNPEELTDSIMNSLPEQDAPVEKQEHKRRLVPIRWRWVAAAACLLIIIGVGVSYQFSDSPQAISQNSTDLHNKLHGLSQQTPRTFTTNSTDFHDKVHGLLPQSPRTSEKESTDSNSTERSQPVDPEPQPTDPNVHYAHHSAATSEDTTYLAPSLVDDFIAKFANYYKVTPVALNCADDSTETRVVSNAYVFPDKEEVNVIGRMLQMAVKYGNDAPGYGLSLSRDQFIFQLTDNRKQTKYLWLAERVRGYILLYATHAPMEAEISSACYQDFRENFTHTKQTRKM